MSRGSPFWDNVVIVSISGIIGAGKSTAITLLDENQDLVLKYLGSPNTCLCFVKEPSKKWRKHGWTNQFYADPQKMALAFQFLVFTTHVKAVEKAIRKKREEHKQKGTHIERIICIVERCMWDQLLFWKIQGRNTGSDYGSDYGSDSDPDLEEGSPPHSSSMEDDAYMQVWNRWNDFLPPVSKIFFCKTSDLNKTMERVKLRASMIEEEKEGVSLEYQQLLYNKHCEWYTEGKTSITYMDGKHKRIESSIDCVHLNTDLPFHTDGDALRELACELAEELREYTN
jgi:deoxyadenosine/deoxycytidine kinase